MEPPLFADPFVWYLNDTCVDHDVNNRSNPWMSTVEILWIILRMHAMMLHYRVSIKAMNILQSIKLASKLL